MRALKRWWQFWRAEIKLAPRVFELTTDLAQRLKLNGRPKLVPSGARGHDSIYRVTFDGKTLGMLRVLNPYRARAQASGMPFRVWPGNERIAREHDIYKKAGALGLTPAPLWHTADALLCSYLPYAPLDARLRAHPEDSWMLLMKAAVRLGKLHAAGITHMDASLANTLADEALENIVFIDFEYAPSTELSTTQQQAYDYLRLLESSWKFIPADHRAEGDEWFAYVKMQLDPTFTPEDLHPLMPALGRILQAPETATRVRALFNYRFLIGARRSA